MPLEINPEGRCRHYLIGGCYEACECGHKCREHFTSENYRCMIGGCKCKGFKAIARQGGVIND